MTTETNLDGHGQEIGTSKTAGSEMHPYCQSVIGRSDLTGPQSRGSMIAGGEHPPARIGSVHQPPAHPG